MGMTRQATNKRIKVTSGEKDRPWSTGILSQALNNTAGGLGSAKPNRQQRRAMVAGKGNTVDQPRKADQTKTPVAEAQPLEDKA
jgi:hypothetical protein